MNGYQQPAFPAHGSMGEIVEHGISLRDYFAARAMQAVLAKIEPKDVTMVPEIAYGVADMMLVERAK